MIALATPPLIRMRTGNSARTTMIAIAPATTKPYPNKESVTVGPGLDFNGRPERQPRNSDG